MPEGGMPGGAIPEGAKSPTQENSDAVKPPGGACSAGKEVGPSSQSDGGVPARKPPRRNSLFNALLSEGTCFEDVHPSELADRRTLNQSAGFMQSGQPDQSELPALPGACERPVQVAPLAATPGPSDEAQTKKKEPWWGLITA